MKEKDGITGGNTNFKAGDTFPLISVVMATYNYAQYLRTAIDSVLNQTYPNTELIVIDDGSTDDTRTVVAAYPKVRYLFHSNCGVSASRNAGIRAACGEYICFLDSDDWLEPNGLFENYQAIKDFPELAFVSGNYYLLHAETGQTDAVKTEVPDRHYIRLLQCNYIGMLAAVLFRKTVLDQVAFDANVMACEDYDLFLRIARSCPVAHHQGFTATYYHHANSLSHDYPLMMAAVYAVLKKQEPFICSEEERNAFEQGITQWRQYETLSNEQTEV